MIRGRAGWLALAAFALALGLRLAFGLGYWVHKPLTLDEREYLDLARNLASGRGFTYTDPDADHFGRAPLYPLFLAAAAGGAPDRLREDAGTPSTVKVAQGVVGAITVLVIAAIARRAYGDAAGAAAALIAAVYPPFVWMPAYALSETLYAALALTSVLLLQRAMDAAGAADRSTVPAIGAGITAALAALARPGALFFAAAAIAWLAWRRRRSAALAFAVAALLTIAPWTVRNLRAHERLVLIATEGGVTFWTGNNLLARGEGDMAANPEIKRAYLAIRARHADVPADALEPIYYAEALAYIRERPIAWAALIARKLAFVWLPIGPSYTLHSPRYLWTSVLSYALLLAAAVAAFVKGGWRCTRAAGVWLLAASAVVMCLVFFPQERFRVASIDPALVICAAALRSRSANA